MGLGLWGGAHLLVCYNMSQKASFYEAQYNECASEFSEDVRKIIAQKNEQVPRWISQYVQAQVEYKKKSIVIIEEYEAAFKTGKFASFTTSLITAVPGTEAREAIPSLSIGLSLPLLQGASRNIPVSPVVVSIVKFRS